MNYFKVLVECGHVGAGNSHDVVRYFEAENILTLLERLKTLPRLKRRRTLLSVKSIEIVDKKRFFEGRTKEEQDPYLSRGRLKGDSPEKFHKYPRSPEL